MRFEHSIRLKYFNILDNNKFGTNLNLPTQYYSGGEDK